MRGLLADTHVLLWWRADDARLSAPAREAMADPENELFFSAGSIWEMAIKEAAGKLDVPDDFVATMADRGFAELPITARHGLVAGGLPPHHRDPFDRMLVAQARAERLAVVTGDARIAAYEVPLLW